MPYNYGMARVFQVYEIIGKDPMRAGETVTSVFFILLGLYLLSPWHTILVGTPMFEFLFIPYVNLVYSIFYFIVGVLGITAVRKNTIAWRGASTFGFFAMFTLIVLIRILTIGFIPIVWVWPLLLMVIAGIANIHLKWRQSEK